MTEEVNWWICNDSKYLVSIILRPERKTSHVRCGKRPREIIRKASSLYSDFWPSCFWLVWLLSRFCIYLERVSYHSVMKTLEQFIAINLFWKGWGPLELSMWFKNLSDIFLSCSVMTALLHSQSGSLNVWDSPWKILRTSCQSFDDLALRTGEGRSLAILKTDKKTVKKTSKAYLCTVIPSRRL